MFGGAEMAVVESVRMHFHEKGYCMKGEKDLGGPCPAKHKWPARCVTRVSKTASGAGLT